MKKFPSAKRRANAAADFWRAPKRNLCTYILPERRKLVTLQKSTKREENEKSKRKGKGKTLYEKETFQSDPAVVPCFSPASKRRADDVCRVGRRAGDGRPTRRAAHSGRQRLRDQAVHEGRGRHRRDRRADRLGADRARGRRGSGGRRRDC